MAEHSEDSSSPPSRSVEMSTVSSTGTFFVLLAGLIFFAKDFLLPIVLALLLTLTFSPIVRSLSRFRIPAAISAMMVVIVLASSSAGAVYVLSDPVTTWLDSISAVGPKLKEHWQIIRAPIEEVMEASKELEEVATQGSNESVQRVIVQQPGLLARAATDLVSTLTTIAVTVVLLFFLLASGTLFYEKLVSVLPTLSDKKRALTIVRTVEQDVSAYLLTITCINISLGVVIGVALHFLGVPNALLWGVMAALLNFVPYVGAIVGAVLVSVVTLLSMDSIATALTVGTGYLLVSGIEGQLVTPTLVGRRLELNTVVIFIAIALWAWLWGPIGAVIAVPMLVVLKVLCDHFESLGTLGEFLSK